MRTIKSATDIIKPSNMRVIKYIVLHCTAGPQNQSTQEILNFWKNVNGWKNPGYHFEIDADGTITELLPIEKIANGVAGHNANSIHISYKGGIDAKGLAIDNRTIKQKGSQVLLIKRCKDIFPNAVVLGHRDFSTDLNGNGIIDQWEWIKSCPAFDVRDWLKAIDLSKEVQPVGIIYKLNYPLIKNEKVKEIQKALAFYGASVVADGVFGAMTDEAVKRFQSKNRLTPDGIVGKNTAEKLGIKL
jgi:N-acetylmuramoyl-L-alanine amidase